jgi:kynurenine formamidase
MGSKANKSLDDFPLSAFMGKARVLDASHLDQGSDVPLELVISAGFQQGEIAIVFTGYEPPGDPNEYPIYSALSPDAAKHLADLPIRAFATDALGVDRLTDFGRLAQEGATEYERLLPIHHTFLTRDVLVYEQLQNLSELLEFEELYFVGVPLKISGGNGMIVRPVVFVE